MGAVTPADPRVSQAVVAWTGFGKAPAPVRDESLVEECFGDLAVDLMPVVRMLDDAFYESDARHVATDEADMARHAAADFRATYPAVAEDAVKALAWCYTYDYR